MKGKYHFKVSSKKLLFEFDIKRNITFLQGKSATGKTTLLEMLYQYLMYGRGSGYTVDTDANFTVYLRHSLTRTWVQDLSQFTNTIIFIEENNNFVRTSEFTRFVKTSGNYFVFVNRKSLKMLPYSVAEIYNLHSEYSKDLNKYVYTFQQRYPLITCRKNNIKTVITEDSNSGFEFFSKVMIQTDVISSNGNTKLINLLRDLDKTHVLCILDGAAFGGYIKDLISLCNQQKEKHIVYWAPESFEFILLNARIIEFSDLDDILKETYNYVNSSSFFSWEQFFTWLIINKSFENSKYSKNSLNTFYLKDSNVKKVRGTLPQSIKSLVPIKSIKTTAMDCFSK